MQKFSSVIARLIVSVFCLALLIPAAQSQTRRRPAPQRSTALFLPIPHGTEIKIRLEDEIDSKKSRDGDRFTATVLSPRNYADATIVGHVAKIDESGKLSGKTELSLTFDRISLRNGQSGRMAAQVVKVYGEDSVQEVDEEGNGKSRHQGKNARRPHGRRRGLRRDRRRHRRRRQRRGHWRGDRCWGWRSLDCHPG